MKGDEMQKPSVVNAELRNDRHTTVFILRCGHMCDKKLSYRLETGRQQCISL